MSAAMVATVAFAQPRVFRCVDAKGKVTYTQTGCDSTADQRRLGERVPAPAPPMYEQRASEHSRSQPPVAAQPPAAAQPPSGPARPIRRGAEAEAGASPEPASPTPAPAGPAAAPASRNPAASPSPPSASRAAPSPAASFPAASSPAASSPAGRASGSKTELEPPDYRGRAGQQR